MSTENATSVPARVRTYPDSVEAGLMNNVPVFARTGTPASLELSVPSPPAGSER